MTEEFESKLAEGFMGSLGGSVGLVYSDFEVTESDDGRMVAALKDEAVERLLISSPPEKAGLINSLRGLHYVLGADEETMSAFVVERDGSITNVSIENDRGCNVADPGKSRQKG
jgi:hypothetical protein